jgi:acetolactate synthase I/II/III large subunit
MDMKVAELFVRSLENEGVRWIFGVPGEENLDLIDALRNSSIQFVVTRHEQGAAMMASAVGQITGTPGVCLSTLGPGATNLVTGVANANMDHVPLVAISGQSGLGTFHKESHQYLDLEALFQPVVKWRATIHQPESVPEIIRKSFRTAASEKPGAVHISLPEDVAAIKADGRPLPWNVVSQGLASPLEMKQAVQQINRAKTPVILAGNGVSRAGGEEGIRKLAEQLQAPVLETFMGKGSLPCSHPLSLPMGLYPDDLPLNAALRADLIIAVGYDMVETPPEMWNSKGVPVVHIDSQQAEVDAHYPVSASVVGSIPSNLHRLAEAVEPKEKDPYWESLHERIWKELRSGEKDNSYPVKPHRFLFDLREVMDPEDRLLVDVGAHKVWAGRLFPCHRPQTCFISNGLASMGIALPGAIGAKMADPGRKVAALCGDGAFQMNVQELETAVRLELPIVIVVWRDEGYGLIEWEQQVHFGRSAHVRFGNPDLVKLAEAYGARGYRVERTEELQPLLERAFKQDGPVVIDCPVDYSENMKLTQRLKGHDKRS